MTADGFPGYLIALAPSLPTSLLHNSGPRNPNPASPQASSELCNAGPHTDGSEPQYSITMGLFNFITTPTSYQNAQIGSLVPRDQVSLASTAVTMFNEKLPPHSQHPNFGHLTLLVFEAVLEVVCVSLPGYLVARQGLFDAESQKFLANLNVTLFTPCLSIASRATGFYPS